MIFKKTKTQIPEFSEEYQKQLVKYLFQCILSEGSKIILFALIFLKLGILKEYLYALVLLVFLRTNGGGLHFKHYLSCFAMSFCVLLGSVMLGIYIPMLHMIALVIIGISIFIGYKYVPVMSANRPPASDKLVKNSKRNTTIILAAYFILICIVPTNRYLSIGVWIIIMHILQLLLAEYLRKAGPNTCGKH